MRCEIDMFIEWNRYEDLKIICVSKHSTIQLLAFSSHMSEKIKPPASSDEIIKEITAVFIFEVL